VQPTQRWRDLVGFYTRFGDVKPLLQRIDDRYVIMNAGDEMQLKFPQLSAPPAGWKRDFVFISDGWTKDGNLNTGFSKTLLPLPVHSNPEYSTPRALAGRPGLSQKSALIGRPTIRAMFRPGSSARHCAQKAISRW
jgi:hypothetical protein